MGGADRRGDQNGVRDAVPIENREVSMTREEVIVFAISLQQRRNYADAETIYRRLLEIDPNDIDALHYLGILLHQTGRHEAALASLQEALRLQPENGPMWSNYGNVLVDQGDADGAVAAYETAVKHSPSHAQAHNNLGVVRRALGDLAGAEAAYREAVAVDPDEVSGWHNLSNLLLFTGRGREAIDCIAEIMVRRPEDTASFRHLALAYERTGQPDKAIETYLEWKAQEPRNPRPDYHIKILRGEAIDRTPDEYVEHLFDGFAASFEAKLEKLGYRAPELCAAALVKARPGASQLTILDAGCGTGWCGPSLRPMAARLDGVDLSEGMIAKARARGLYDALYKAELTAFVSGLAAAYDAIVVCDTFCYFGRLEPVAQAIAKALAPGGVIVATFEAADGTDDYALPSHGRFAHAGPYIERCFTAAGLSSIALQREDLRIELADTVIGWLAVFAKP